LIFDSKNINQLATLSIEKIDLKNTHLSFTELDQNHLFYFQRSKALKGLIFY